jgi:hypothetical protein
MKESHHIEALIFGFSIINYHIYQGLTKIFKHILKVVAVSQRRDDFLKRKLPSG